MDLLRELDGAVEDNSQKVDTKEQANNLQEEVPSVVDDKKVGLTREVVSESQAENEKKNGNNHEEKIDAFGDQRSERQIRGDQNPNRLLILKLTREQPMTVPSLEKELSVKIGKISKQSVDNWVKKLLGEKLLIREESPDPASKGASCNKGCT